MSRGEKHSRADSRFQTPPRRRKRQRRETPPSSGKQRTPMLVEDKPAASISLFSSPVQLVSPPRETQSTIIRDAEGNLITPGTTSTTGSLVREMGGMWLGSPGDSLNVSVLFARHRPSVRPPEEQKQAAQHEQQLGEQLIDFKARVLFR
ncbi:MAG: hypothetical protein P1U40_10275 [Coxiellaceae bacterium]|nr:hypothetical protein [Coxiellaceae bacterium]